MQKSVVLGDPLGLPVEAEPMPDGMSYRDIDPHKYFIRACDQCAVSQAEIIRLEDRRQVVREWHHPACPLLDRGR